MGVVMKIAVAYQYKEIPVLIKINQLSETAIIWYLDKSITMQSMDITWLKRVVETEIDKEKNDDLYNNSYEFCTYVPF